MNQKKIFGISTLAVISMTLGLAISGVASTPVRADAACNVPVCDMNAAIAGIRAGSEKDRNETVSTLHRTYLRSTDLPTLKNLAEYAKKAEALFNEIYPQDDINHSYLAREASLFYADMIIGLAKYSPLDAPVMAGYFGQLPTLESRYAVLLYWHSRINEFDSKDPLLTMLEFFGKAENISRAAASGTGGDDYAVREAHIDQDIISTRLVQLYPYFEGTYKITVSCKVAEGTEMPGYCKDGFMDRLVIMDTMGGNGIQISISNTASGTVMYSFPNSVLSNGGSTFESQGSPSGVLSQLHLDLDHHSGLISGFIRNSDSLSTLQIQGTLEASPTSVYDLQARSPKQEALSGDQIVGAYKGVYSGRNVTLSVVKFPGDAFGATLSFADQPTFKLRFQASRYYSSLGILVLVSTNASAHVKLTAFFGKADKGFKVDGFGFTDLNGATQTLALTSIAQN